MKTHRSVEVLRAVCEQDPERPSTAVVRKEEIGPAEETKPAEPAAAATNLPSPHPGYTLATIPQDGKGLLSLCVLTRDVLPRGR